MSAKTPASTRLSVRIALPVSSVMSCAEFLDMLVEDAPAFGDQAAALARGHRRSAGCAAWADSMVLANISLASSVRAEPIAVRRWPDRSLEVSCRTATVRTCCS